MRMKAKAPNQLVRIVLAALAAVRQVKTIRVTPEGFQAEFGAKVDRASLVGGAGVALQVAGDAASAHVLGAVPGLIRWFRDPAAPDDLIPKTLLQLIQGRFQLAGFLRAIVP